MQHSITCTFESISPSIDNVAAFCLRSMSGCLVALLPEVTLLQDAPLSRMHLTGRMWPFPWSNCLLKFLTCWCPQTMHKQPLHWQQGRTGLSASQRISLPRTSKVLILAGPAQVQWHQCTMGDWQLLGNCSPSMAYRRAGSKVGASGAQTGLSYPDWQVCITS